MSHAIYVFCSDGYAFYVLYYFNLFLLFFFFAALLYNKPYARVRYSPETRPET